MYLKFGIYENHICELRSEELYTHILQINPPLVSSDEILL